MSGTIDMSNCPCCDQSSGGDEVCCGFTCDAYPPIIQLAINVLVDNNGICASLFPAATLTFAGDCDLGQWTWTGTIANGVSGTLRCNNGQWEFRSECDPLHWHAVTIISCNPFHATATATLSNFFGFCCDGTVELEFTL